MRTGRSLRIVGENGTFRAAYDLQPLDARRFRIRFEGRLLQDVPAELEYAAGYFNANLFAGRPFRAEGPSGERKGKVAVFPAGADQASNDLAPGFRALEFDSRIGRLRLDVTADQRVMFFDARRDSQAWAKTAPVFWCGLGVPARRLKYGTPARLELIVTVDPASEPPRKSVSIRPIGTRVEAAFSPVERPVRVIPQPKSMRGGSGAFRLEEGIGWSVSAPEGEARLVPAVRSLLDERLGLQSAPDRTTPSRDAWTTLRIGAAPPARPPEPAAGEGREWARNAEGYRLAVSSGGIRIDAPTARGAFYALQTLAQLIRTDRAGLYCGEVAIEDWPSMSFRGAHWFPSASGVGFHRKLLERVMARFKLNHAVIQCEAARWDSHPEIAAPNSIGKEALGELVELARSRFIEPVPLINTPGHAEWMFRNGRNLEFAEDPETPYAYCVRHPKSDAFIREILGEAIALFRPRMFHLGHDEVDMRGRFPRPDCPRCSGSTQTGLILEHVKRLHGRLAEQGIRTMIWGDMLLGPGESPEAAHAPSVPEARARRAALPRDLTVAHWYYGPGDPGPALDLFRNEGLSPVACTWFEPMNIYRTARAVASRPPGTLPGLLQTTWCGYFPDEQVLETELRQFSAFVLAAEYAWSGRTEPPDALPYDPASEFLRAYSEQGAKDRPGVLVDLSAAAAVGRESWLGLGPGWDLAKMPGGTVRLEDVLFAVPKERVVLLGSGMAPAEAAGGLELELERTARRVSFLNAAAWAVPNGTVAARMTVEYADGAELSSDFVVGRSTAAWSDDGPAPRALVAWKEKSPAGTPIALRVTHWENPHPEKQIRRLRLVPVDPEAGWALAGLTLLE